MICSSPPASPLAAKNETSRLRGLIGQQSFSIREPKCCMRSLRRSNGSMRPVSRFLSARRAWPRRRGVINGKIVGSEAAVIARAGEFGAVTISTQISGRGTDIVLGGKNGWDRERVVALGGLAVVAVGPYQSSPLHSHLPPP